MPTCPRGTSGQSGQPQNSGLLCTACRRRKRRVWWPWHKTLQPCFYLPEHGNKLYQGHCEKKWFIKPTKDALSPPFSNSSQLQWPRMFLLIKLFFPGKMRRGPMPSFVLGMKFLCTSFTLSYEIPPSSLLALYIEIRIFGLCKRSLRSCHSFPLLL